MKNAIILATLFFSLVFPNLSPALSIDDEWIFSVAYIVNQSTGSAGTGFFVFRQITSDKGKLFLVSNKHVLLPKPVISEKDPKQAIAIIHITTESEGSLSTSNFPLVLRDQNGKSFYVGHPKDNVDVAAIDVTQYLTEKESICLGYKVGYVHESRFASKKTITETSLTLGDRIVILGYPLNMIEGSTAIAVARGGTIATPPDRDYRGAPMFLIDGTAIRGSSGSPVFVPVRPYTIDRKTKGKVIVNTFQACMPELLGILSATVPDWELILKKTVMFGAEPQSISVVDTANLGIVFRADVISETLDISGVQRFSGENK